MSKNKISWCTATWNPIVGCSKCSPGCKNCYAERMAKRLKGIGLPQYQDVVDKNGWTGKTSFVFTGFKHKKSALIFVCSMGDLFHETVPTVWQDTVFDFIESQPQHKFIILTKRPDRLYNYSIRWGAGCFPENVWIGTSVSTQVEMNRVEHIYHIPAPVRFISFEPLLEEIVIPPNYLNGDRSGWPINWVIVGGESGPGARPMYPDWVRSIRDQCLYSGFGVEETMGTPFHFKQWGEYGPVSGDNMVRMGKKNSGRLLDGKIYNEFPWCLK